MNPNIDQSRHCPKRWARLKKQLQQARAEANNYHQKFEIEKRAKNNAYAFILTSGQLAEFKKWVEQTKGLDPMEICRSYSGIKQRYHNDCPDEGNATDRTE
jgi:hypothetical protein